MGQILDFPFAASVWGTVPAWVGAIGTTSAFLLGYNVYRQDAKLRRYEQAIMVLVSEVSAAPLGIMALYPENLAIEVHNTSRNYVYSVGGSLYRRSLIEMSGGFDVVGPTRNRMRPTDESRAAILESFRTTVEDWGFGRTIDRVGPGEVMEFKFVAPYTPQHRLSVTFTDAQNQHWEISETRDRIFSGEMQSLAPINNRWRNFMRMMKICAHLSVPPHKVLVYYWDRAAQTLWAIRNGRWGPGVEGWTQRIYKCTEPIIKDEPDTR